MTSSLEQSASIDHLPLSSATSPSAAIKDGPRARVNDNCLSALEACTPQKDVDIHGMRVEGIDPTEWQKVQIPLHLGCQMVGAKCPTNETAMSAHFRLAMLELASPTS
jgi:hypothetical protein